jgi:hypothetical protein
MHTSCLSLTPDPRYEQLQEKMPIASKSQNIDANVRRQVVLKRLFRKVRPKCKVYDAVSSGSNEEEVIKNHAPF